MVKFDVRIYVQMSIGPSSALANQSRRRSAEKTNRSPLIPGSSPIPTRTPSRDSLMACGIQSALYTVT